MASFARHDQLDGCHLFYCDEASSAVDEVSDDLYEKQRRRLAVRRRCWRCARRRSRQLDRIFGEAGNDTAYGGYGADTIEDFACAPITYVALYSSASPDSSIDRLYGNTFGGGIDGANDPIVLEGSPNSTSPSRIVAQLNSQPTQRSVAQTLGAG